MANKTYIVENANNPIESDFYKDIIQKDANGNPLVDSQNRIRVKRYVVHGSVGLNEASVDAKINTAKSEINSTIADLHHVTTDTTQTVSGNKTFTGETRVPTVDSSDSSTKAASTAFVQGKVTALQNTLNTFLDSDDATLDQASELVAAIKANKKDIASLVADKATKVELAEVASKATKAITDVGQVVDPATHMPIEATTASVGVVQLATAQDITNGTANKVVDAQELNNFVQTLPAVSGVTDVSSGNNSNQIVVAKLGGSKTLTIDNVEHAGTATSANSVAWNNVSGKPSTFAPATHNHDSAYLGITAKAASAKSADSVAWNNVSGKPSTYTPSSHTHDDRYYTESEINTKLSNLLLYIYPVGSIYISANSTNPGTLFGGTWKALDQGRVLIGANSTYKAGATGGEFTHTITTSEMPSHTHTGTTGNQSAGHTHTWSGTTSSNGSHAHTASSNSTGSHSHNAGQFTIYGWGAKDSPNNVYINATVTTSPTIGNWATIGNNMGDAGSHSHTITVNSNGAHTHTVSGTTGGISANHTHSFTTGASGSGSAMNNMQPYLAVYMWQRTA